MEDRELDDKIKRKEQDIMNTLQNIAEAALNDIDDDFENDNEVDSELSKVANEISKNSTAMAEDNSDQDFEDIIDDAVEINDSEYVADEYDANNERIKHGESLEIDDITKKFTKYENGYEPPEQKVYKNIRSKVYPCERVSEPEDCKSHEEDAESWKIDYIRVETEIEKKTDTMKMEKQNSRKGRKRNHLKKTQQSHSSNKTIRLDAEHSSSYSKRRKSSKSNHIIDKTVFDKRNHRKKPQEKKEIKIRKNVNWEEIFKTNDDAGQKSSLQQILGSTLPVYKPPPQLWSGDWCMAGLAAGELEPLQCPACPDTFLIPTSFFQHIYRKSVNISFDCQVCQKNMVFHNKCSLKIHILGHLESKESEIFKTDMLHVMSLNDFDLKLHSNFMNLKNELRKTSCLKESQEQCTECHAVLDKKELESHYQAVVGRVEAGLECEQCSRPLPNRCSLLAHTRLHAAKPPYTCPECGEQFLTWQQFRPHVTRACLHGARRLFLLCPRCPDQHKFAAADAAQLATHWMAVHTRSYSKCPRCPVALADPARLARHAAQQHAGHPDLPAIATVYKTKIGRSTRFFSGRAALLEQLERELQSRAQQVFMFSCVGCEEFFWGGVELRSHQEEQQHGGGEEDRELFPAKSGEQERVRATLDSLRGIQEEAACVSCRNYNQTYQTHLEQHASTVGGRGEERAEGEKVGRRITRNLKRQSQEVELKEKLDDSSLQEEEKPVLLSPPLKLKIKLTPEITKSLDAASTAPSLTATVTPAKSRSRNSKVKFQLPQPLVESLGLDVPSGRDLILLNRLFHSPNALESGCEVVAAVPGRSGYRCSVCGHKEEDRLEFQSHIRSHRSCQSHHQCEECGACFAVQPSWAKHLLLMHRIKQPGPERFTADLHPDLDYSFSDSEADLVIDTGEEVGADCLACGAQFPSRAGLRDHTCSFS